jgi:HAMP domain-containing protein
VTTRHALRITALLVAVGIAVGGMLAAAIWGSP